MFEHLIESSCAFVEMVCQILLVKADMREIQPAISADHCQFDAALLQRLSDALGNEALSRCIDPADSDKQGVLRRERFSLLDNRRNHRTIFEHELQPKSVITAGSDLLAAKPLPNRAMLRSMSMRRRSYSSAIQLAAVRH